MFNKNYLSMLGIVFFFLPTSINASPKDECLEASFDKSLYGLCQAYLNGKNCLADENKDSARCSALRRNFSKLSGGQDIDDILNGNGGTNTTIIGIDGGVAELQNVARVTFPSGAFDSDTTVSLSATSDNNVHQVFDEFTRIFRPSGRLSYEVRIGTGIEPPSSETVEVELFVPASFVNSIPKDYGIEAFMMVEHGGVDEIPYPIFELVSSEYDTINQIITFELPGAAFSNSSLTQNEFQAIVTLAPTPGINNVTNQIQVQSLAFASATNASSSTCQAASIKCPVAGGCTVTSKYDKARKHPLKGGVRPHYGTDYKAATGTSITAASGGKVESSYNSTSYGETIILRHTDGSATLYAHLQGRDVNVGDSVTAGQQIGTANSTGQSTGPHLHLEYVPNGQIIRSKNRIDPDACIDALASGSITVRDSGNLADDAFSVSVDGFVIGQTSVGGTNTLAISNLKPGNHVLSLTVIIAPDNVGTYTVTLNDGLVFSDGTTSKTGWAPQGATLTWSFVVPQN